MKSIGPKVLLVDIETAPILAYVWSIWDQNVGLNQIKNDWFILSWAAKWLGEKEVMYADSRNEADIENDKPILEKVWKLLDEADIVIWQNGKQFDHKKLNSRFLMNDMKPPSPYRQIDTLEISKRHFSNTSNKLEYLTDKLCVKYKKLKHKKFPGFEMWSECLKRNKDAWKQMERYNKYDVLSLEELYTKLQAWDQSINFKTYAPGSTATCNCGSTRPLDNRGWAYTNLGKYRRYKCRDCGANLRDRVNLLDIDTRKALKTKAA